MKWMIIRIVEKTSEKNIIKNGDGLSAEQAENRIGPLLRRCPVGQRFEKIEYDPRERGELMTRLGILEESEFL